MASLRPLHRIRRGKSLGGPPEHFLRDEVDHTITYDTPEVTIDMIAVQPGHDDQTFEVHALTNPTLIVPVKAVVHLNLVNMDFGANMEHGLVLTAEPPPFRTWQ